MTSVSRATGAAEWQDPAAALFAGAGEMRALCRAHDWASTPLGPVADWSPCLRAAAQMVLGAGTPMLLFWGPELVQIFNDRFRPSLGESIDLSQALGARGAEFWSEIWTYRGPQIAHVLNGGAPVEHADVLLPMLRNGTRENVWWSWSDSPLFGDDGNIAGVLVACQETSASVRESRRLTDVFRHAPSFLAVLRGPDYVFEQANDAYYQLVGHRELLGKPLLDALPEVRAQGFVTDLLDAVRTTQEPHVGRETPILLARTPDAQPEQRFVDFVYLPLVEEDGSCTGVIAHGTDITEQVLARRDVERLLAESEAARRDVERARQEADLSRRRLETLLEHLPVGVTLAEAPSGRLVVSNAAVGRIWGHDTPAAQVKDYSAVYIGFRPRPEPEAARQYSSEDWPLARALLHGEVVTDEVIEIGWPDGSRRTVSVSAAPVRDGAGALIGGVVMTQDVHERERLLAAERAGRERTERLQAITEALARARTMDDVADVVVERMGGALHARTSALAVRSPDGDSLMLLRTAGFPEPVELTVWQQPLVFQSPLTECFRTQTPVWVEGREGAAGLDARYPAIAPVWDTLHVQSAAYLPLVVAEASVGTISFAFEHARAFTPDDQAFFRSLAQQTAVAVERARLFEAERAARAEAERANKAKSEFLAIMSHELRTPLNAIDGYAELMELGVRGPITEEQRQDLARIRKSEKHLLGLINGVLNYAQVEAGAVHYELEPIPLEEVLSTCEALTAPQIRANRLTLHREPCPPTLCVAADREKLQQIVLNLLSNAIKFTGPGGHIDMHCVPSTESAGERADTVQLVVHDTGIGIPESQLTRIFEPFVQVDSELTRTREGTGLGLAISRDLARGMGGELTAASTPGHGSTFTLTLRPTSRA